MKVRRLDAAGVPAAQTRQLSADGENAGSPAIGVGGLGSVVVWWRRFDGVKDSVQASAFDTPDVGLDPVMRGFGTVAADGGSSAPQKFTISNTGSAELAISSVGIGGNDPSQFQLIGGSTCTGATLRPAASCEVEARSSSTLPGSFSARLLVESNAPSSPAIAELTGLGTGTSGTEILPPTPPGRFRIKLGRVRLDPRHGTARRPSPCRLRE